MEWLFTGIKWPTSLWSGELRRRNGTMTPPPPVVNSNGNVMTSSSTVGRSSIPHQQHAHHISSSAHHCCNSRYTPPSSSSNLLMRRTPSQCHCDCSKGAMFPRPKTASMIAQRLRVILQQLDGGSLKPADLRKNLEYACLVLEAAYNDDGRRFLQDDEDEAEDDMPEEVPVEVKEWLASTFTRRETRKRQKFRFKSVANAIRSGIVFDRIFRRISVCPQVHIPVDVQDALKLVDAWEFDIFHLNEVSENKALKYITLDLFHRYSLLSRFRISVTTLECFLQKLEAGYSIYNNPYHNSIHAADVFQTTHFWLSQTGLLTTLSDVEIYACLFAALIHDFEHSGHTNNFHIQSLSDMALLYNDKSVLENHHISAVFRFMRDDPEANILASLSKDEFKEFRGLVIDIVLATDMSMHFSQLKLVKAALIQPDGLERSKVLSLLVHASDISHPTKPWPVHYKWTNSVLEEFFRQGDLEASLGLPYSPLCDRSSTHVAESQIGFIDFIVEPCYAITYEMLNKLLEPIIQAQSGSTPDQADSARSQFASPPFDDGKHLAVSDRSGSAYCSMTGTSNNLKRMPPVGPDGKLALPQPFVKLMRENKARWKQGVSGTSRVL